MLVAKTKSVRFRLEPELQDGWMAFCEARVITQQAAVESMIKWIMKQEEEVQAMVLGQLQPKGYIVKQMLEKLASTTPGEPRTVDKEGSRLGVIPSKDQRRRV